MSLVSFRSVPYPSRANSQLLLHSMPGLHEPLDVAIAWMHEQGVDHWICLNPLEEIRIHSPDLAVLIERELLPLRWTHFPIRNYAVPEDPDRFLKLVRHLAAEIKAGHRLLIHCLGGVGRSGTLAASLLIDLEFDPEDALALVAQAHAGPETDEQSALLHWIFRAVRRDA